MLFDKNLVLDEKNYMLLDCKGKSENWNIDCSFNAGIKETEDDWAEFEDLTNSLCKRLNNLCKLADTPFDTSEEVFSDGELSCYGGNAYAESRVENGNLIFEIDFGFVGGGGAVYFNFGRAVKEREKRVSSLVSRMYDFLGFFTYFVKHHCIDTSDWEDWEEETVDEEE